VLSYRKPSSRSPKRWERWPSPYGGLQVEQAKKLKELQRENAQLRRAVAGLTVEKQILKDVAEGTF